MLRGKERNTVEGYTSRLRRVALVMLSLVATTLVWGTAPASAAAPPAAPVEAWLTDQLSAAGDQQLLVLVGASSATMARQAIVTAGATPFRTFEQAGFSSALLTSQQVEVVRRQAGVRYLQGNRQLAPSMETATAASGVDAAEELWEEFAGETLDGTGVGIAIVDSGMAGDHPMFRDAANTGTRLLNIKQACVVITACAVPGEVEDAFFVDATGTDTDVMAAGGHGTHVTSIAGGSRVTTSNGASTRGVAPGADLYGLGAGAGIFTLNAAASLNWVLEHHEDPCGAFALPPAVVGGCAPISVVSNSYGGNGEYSSSDVFAVLSTMLVLDGVVVVWSAGNGAEITDTDPPPNDGTVNLVNPSSVGPLPGILSIANYDDQNSGTREGTVVAGSSRGERGRPETYPDFAAPGTNILAACRPYLPVCTSAYADPNYGEISGTSMAAPHVAGIVALLLQAYPDLTPAQVEDLLEDTARQIGDPSEYEPDVATAGAPVPGQTRNGNHLTHYYSGHGLVDLAAALSELSGAPVPDAGDPCSAATSFAADPQGDATDVGGFGLPVPGEVSDPNFDITGIGVQLDEGLGVVRFTVDVLDVADDGVTASTGEYIRFDFTYEGFSSELVLRRNLDGAETFRLVIPGIASSVVVLPALTGDFDGPNNQVWAEIPLDALVGNANVSPAVTAFAAGDQIGNVTVLMQRQVGTPATGGATLTADTALGGCAFVLGAGDGPVLGAGGEAAPVVPDLPVAVPVVPGAATPSGALRARPASVVSDLALPAAAVLAAALLVGMAARGNRRRLIGTGVVALAAVGAVLGSSLPAGAVTAPAITFTQADESFALDVTVAEPNLGTSCVTAAADTATYADGPACLVVPITTDQPDSRSLQFLQVEATPTNDLAAVTDIDVYVLEVATGRILGSSASAGLPLAGSVHELAFAALPGDGSYVVVAQAYQNEPGATYNLAITSYGRAAFVD